MAYFIIGPKGKSSMQTIKYERKSKNFLTESMNSTPWLVTLYVNRCVGKHNEDLILTSLMSPFSASSIRAFLARDPRTLNDNVCISKSNNQITVHVRYKALVYGSAYQRNSSAFGVIQSTKYLFLITANK